MSPLISGLASVASLIFNAASSGPGKSAASRRGAGATEPEPSTVLTLSPQAEALAGFAGKGILVSQGKLDGPAVGAVGRGGGSVPAGASGASGGRSVSREDFRDLLARFGATEAQTEQLTAGFDTNKDGSISQDEFLKGLASTKGAQAGSGFSQAVMQLMDQGGNADGTVAQKEFAAFSTAFVAAGQRRA
ncbi:MULTISPECIES: EF-hand domain-containing protein [unclassified Acidovorax]|uniref:EF-hand domain-containing protein n=1 Tax=unclassified Acidovorax TaxID=2684926 RepID=UPI001C43B84A|nr:MULTISPECIES: EF-hand domain-containing protein [unclassified Acidovorax]MBV7426590.1 EF-hand domain-containing protein [Acidovorax sp. sif0732]MBV7447715.1 EF-hand domain-containing protein [Acidovorax sp. sif0715]